MIAQTRRAARQDRRFGLLWRSGPQPAERPRVLSNATRHSRVVHHGRPCANKRSRGLVSAVVRRQQTTSTIPSMRVRDRGRACSWRHIRVNTLKIATAYWLMIGDHRNHTRAHTGKEGLSCCTSHSAPARRKSIVPRPCLSVPVAANSRSPGPRRASLRSASPLVLRSSASSARDASASELQRH